MTYLEQQEADRLIAVEKVRADDNTWSWPAFGGSTVIPLLSIDRRDEFLFDINRGRISMAKVTYQERCYTCVPLIRLDIAGPDHMNPDGEIVPCPHLHRYREGCGMRWATAAPSHFTEPENARTTLEEFLDYCKVVETPMINFGPFA